ncbi:MAG: class I SAM-dependent methyltransferase [Alphaproteobacteria bacterium]|nr:class I SAM-dependent methyltransferase [Alphaproteobacteria bacterium]
MVNIHHGEPIGDVLDEDALGLFRNQWDLYRKLVVNDYLASAEVYGILHGILAREFVKPFRFLDLACGDASGVVSVLKGTRIAHYHGVDLAPPALDMAADNLDALDCEVELEHGDYIEAMRERPEPADIVWIGLSLHHLPTPEKLVLMGEIRTMLGGDGQLVMYEPAMREGEDMDAYADRYERLAKGTWDALSRDEVDAVVTHVRTCDLVETAPNWLALGREVGFSNAETLFVAPSDLLRMYRYRV